LPRALATVRVESWESHVPFPGASKIFQSSPLVALVTVLVVAALFWLIADCLDTLSWIDSIGGIPWASSAAFYDLISHESLILIFSPLFLLPLFILFIGLARYWRTVNGESITWSQLCESLRSAATLKNLDGGAGQGCNYEREDSYSQVRRWAHQATMYGFLLCFAATSVATVMHYGMGLVAPYPFLSLPKLLGVSGGLLLTVGTSKLIYLKTKANFLLESPGRRGSDYGFITLLWFVSTTGLLLYWLGGTELSSSMLILHLAGIACLFISIPFSKMVHGFFRMAALIREAQLRGA
ncbi:4Fe-4S ferredoxin, partial [Litorivicinus sp.]|nr:4Fe-4S ferredoxin [Litorivicinus sp.]